MKQFDVLVIGAGAVGNAVAREISKKNTLTVGVLEKEPDTAFGISGRNSGVLHAGFNNKPGSLMAKLCVEGCEGFEKEAEELGIGFRRTGKLIVARFEEDLERLQKLKEQGEANGVRELRILGKGELEELAGYEAGVGALWSGMTGIFDPFLYTAALAESAAEQGTEFFFGRQVTEIRRVESTGYQKKVNAPSRGCSQRNRETYYRLYAKHTKTAVSKRTPTAGAGRDFLVTSLNHATGEEECFEAGILINSAGLYADEICRMAGINEDRIYPCRGEYHILDRKHSRLLEFPVYPIPNENEGGLGVHLTPAIHGNILIGPSAEYFDAEQEREEYSTTGDVMDRLSKEGMDLFPGLDLRDCIRSFSGIRPKLVSEEEGGYADFVIGESEQVPGFIRLVGIESPGLTASIPIARMVAQIAAEILERNAAPHIGKKSGCATPGTAVSEGIHPAGEPGDQRMICRCEGITEEAILSAYDRILQIGAIPTVKGLKNRTRVTMGNCQGSFCTINIIELLQKKRNVDPLKLLWNGFGSEMFEGSVKG